MIYKKIKVLIVDDSAVVRKVLSQLVDNEQDMEVVGTAQDPYVARDKLVALKPDVMTLDIEMPRMDGLTFLKKVMAHFPIPTVIVSSVTKQGCETSLKALEIGAVSVVPKPSEAYSIETIESQLLHAIRGAATFRMSVKPHATPPPETATPNKPTAPVKDVITSIATTNKIVAIGSSTGGTEALKDVIYKLPSNIPGIVMVQHMPAGFTAAFAQRLNSHAQIEVREARDGDAVQQGLALLAPGDFHMVLRRDGARYLVRLKRGPQVWYQRPAVDVLFKSVAEFAGNNAVGVILTGMGKDGAAGIRMMKDAGSINIAQDEKTSVVYGMPKAAFETGGIDYVEPLPNIADRIVEVVNKKLRG
jgi:two-component system chemotaxis response regulator CheB